MELRIPKVREGSYFPSLLEPRRRSEKALLSVIRQAYVEGVSTRRVDDLVKALGCDGISKSQVSRICRDLDEVVENFLGRPLDGGPYPYVWLDALTQKIRESGRIVNVSVVVATGVNAQGQREVGIFLLHHLGTLLGNQGRRNPSVYAALWWPLAYGRLRNRSAEVVGNQGPA